MISFSDVVIFENSIHDFIANKLISVHTPNSVLSKIALKFYQLQAENLCAFRLCLLPNCFLTAHSSREFVFLNQHCSIFKDWTELCFCVHCHTKNTLNTKDKQMDWIPYCLLQSQFFFHNLLPECLCIGVKFVCIECFILYFIIIMYLRKNRLNINNTPSGYPLDSIESE